VLHSEGLDAYIVRRLGLSFRDVDWTLWDGVLRRVHRPAHQVEVALVGKYIDLPDAYLSVTEALRAGGFAEDARVNLRWVASDDCATAEGAQRALTGVDAVCVPGGFGVRGIDGKLGALRWARENLVPTLGLCLGLQCMVIEYARNAAGILDATSTEFADEPGSASGTPVIATMAEQQHIIDGDGDLGGTMRLGSYPAALSPGSVVAQAYGAERVNERHRHRYEVNNAHRGALEKAGLVFSGTSPDGALVEFVELPRETHPYYVATQAHPEFKSRPHRAHPLFSALIAAAVAAQRAARLVEVSAE
ncbi:MAG: CTP synthase, partial [Angustibacter sp.]